MMFALTVQGLYQLMDEVVAQRVRDLVPIAEFCACDAGDLAEAYPVAWLRLYLGSFTEQL